MTFQSSEKQFKSKKCNGGASYEKSEKDSGPFLPDIH